MKGGDNKAQPQHEFTLASPIITKCERKDAHGAYENKPRITVST